MCNPLNLPVRRHSSSVKKVDTETDTTLQQSLNFKKPAIDNGIVYAVSDDGNVYAFNA